MLNVKQIKYYQHYYRFYETEKQLTILAFHNLRSVKLHNWSRQ